MRHVLADARRGSYRVASHIAYHSSLELAISSAGAILISFYRAQPYIASGVLAEVTGLIPRQAIGRFVFRNGLMSRGGENLIRQLSELIRRASVGSMV